jgi:hypothetical protein
MLIASPQILLRSKKPGTNAERPPEPEGWDLGQRVVRIEPTAQKLGSAKKNVGVEVIV